MTIRKKQYAFPSILLAVCLLCTACGESAAASVMQLMKLEGVVGVSDGEGKKLSPEEKMMLYSGYQMETQNESFAWINLDSVKLTKMDESSDIEIRRDGKQLEILVNSGKLYFNITEPLEDDETLDIRTSTMAVGIRGTCGWVEALDASHMYVYILEGTVQCSVTDPESGETITDTVSSGEMAELILNSGEEGGCEIRKETFAEYGVPDFVRNELAADQELQEKIYQASGMEIPEETILPQTYLEQADMYIRQGEPENALEVLRQGLELFENNEEISAKIEELEAGDTASSEAKVWRYYSYYAENALRYYMEYAYDEQGRANSVATYMEDGSEISRTEILYDGQGNTIQEYYMDSSDGRMGRNTYEYDADGNQIARASYSSGGSLSGSSAFTYDGNGNLIRENLYNADGTATGSYEYTYNAENQLTQKTYLDANENISSYTTYEYDADGNQTRENYFQSDGSLSTYYAYEYDNNGRRTKENYFNADGTLSTSREYEYDANGNIIRQIDHTFWGGTLYSLYEYDSNGNCIRRTDYDSEGNMSTGAAWEYLAE